MNFRLFRLLTAAFFLLYNSSLYAQIDSLVLNTESAQVNSREKNELRFDLDALAFFKDNEYNSKDVVKGYTLPGMWLSPRITYQPLNNLKLEIGAHMLHYWGANSYPTKSIGDLTTNDGERKTKGFHCTPTFRANLQLSPNVNIVLGTLYGKSFHQLTAPLYNDEHCLTSDPETGVQVLWTNRWLQFDTWVDWQKFIYKNDKEQEEFTYGLSAKLMPDASKHRAKLYFPVQLLMHHIGGEINTEAEERSIKTWMNAAVGAGAVIPLRTRIPASINTEVTGHFFSQQKGDVLPYSKGYGLLAKVKAQVKNFSATASYWYADKFISICGSPLYNAMSSVDNQILLRHPNMFLLRGEYAQTLGRGFSWGVCVDFDLHRQKSIYTPETQTYEKGNTTTDVAAGIYLRFQPSFLLKKFKTDQAH